MVRSLARKSWFLVFLLLPIFARAQNTSLDIGSFSFSLTPRILQDGSITDLSLAMLYSDSLGAEIRLRNTKIAKNEEIAGADDSLNAIKETIYEVFVLPIQYRSVKGNLRLTAGAGLYYEYDKLNEKGFFTLNHLEEEGLERVNAYKNDFTMRLAGPLLDAGILYHSEWFNIGLTAGIVPFFHIDFTQRLSIDPLMSPSAANLSEKTWGAPYFYLGLDSIIFKYINATFSYNYARLTKQVITPQLEVDDKNVITNRYWIYPEQSAVTQSIMIEISALLPLKGGISFQAGYGYMHNFIGLDSSPVIQEGRHYLILSTKKTGF
jgi:hypothetical protein